MTGIPNCTINSVMYKCLIVKHKVYQNGINGIVWYMFGIGTAGIPKIRCI